MAIRRHFPTLLLAALALLAPAVPARAAASSNEATMAREIANDINNERAARHLPAIPFDSGAYSAGAQRVAESNRDRPCHACHSADHPSGEVVWWGSDYGSSGSTIWWMGSPPHRALLLAPNATKLGVGVACKGTEHDAVAWIETTSEAQAPPPQPVVTKEGTGTRCNGTRSGPASTSATSPPTTTATTRRATTSTAPPASRNTVTTVQVKVRSNAATPKRTETSRRPPANVQSGIDQAAAAVSAARRVDASPILALDTSPRRAIVVSSDAPSRGPVNGVGATTTAVLAFGFTAVICLGRLTHRRRTVRR